MTLTDTGGKSPQYGHFCKSAYNTRHQQLGHRISRLSGLATCLESNCFYKRDFPEQNGTLCALGHDIFHLHTHMETCKINKCRVLVNTTQCSLFEGGQGYS